jgi:hypothetical protein
VRLALYFPAARWCLRAHHHPRYHALTQVCLPLKKKKKEKKEKQKKGLPE